MEDLVSVLFVAIFGFGLPDLVYGDFGYAYSYSCFKDCGYYKTQEFTFCQKYQRDYCWVPSRRTIMIVLTILLIIFIVAGLFYFLRKCKRKQAKARPMSPPPGSMCIWQA